MIDWNAKGEGYFILNEENVNIQLATTKGMVSVKVNNSWGCNTYYVKGGSQKMSSVQLFSA